MLIRQAEDTEDEDEKEALYLDARLEANALVELLKQLNLGAIPAAPSPEKNPRAQTPMPLMSAGGQGGVKPPTGIE